MLLLVATAMAAPPALPPLTEEEWQRVRAGEVVLHSEAEGPRVTATGVVQVHAPLAQTWPAVLDIPARVPETPTLTSVTEYDRDGNRRWALRVDMEVMGVDLRVHNVYTWDPAHNLATYTLDPDRPNDLAVCDGWYLARPTDGGTLLVYQAVTEAKVYVPAWVRRRLAKDQMESLLRAIRARAERGPTTRG